MHANNRFEFARVAFSRHQGNDCNWPTVDVGTCLLATEAV